MERQRNYFFADLSEKHASIRRVLEGRADWPLDDDDDLLPGLGLYLGSIRLSSLSLVPRACNRPAVFSYTYTYARIYRRTDNANTYTYTWEVHKHITRSHIETKTLTWCRDISTRSYCTLFFFFCFMLEYAREFLLMIDASDSIALSFSILSFVYSFYLYHTSLSLYYIINILRRTFGPSARVFCTLCICVHTYIY